MTKTVGFGIGIIVLVLALLAVAGMSITYDSKQRGPYIGIAYGFIGDQLVGAELLGEAASYDKCMEGMKHAIPILQKQAPEGVTVAGQCLPKPVLPYHAHAMPKQKEDDSDPGPDELPQDHISHL